ncbi:MAG: AMP-binding protein [Acidimicrobiales bacterium]|nr:AMP-binding protein [Acidimicrobiales bacterium]
MSPVKWSKRDVPAALETRYVRDGWWTEETLGGQVATWLADAPDTTVATHSRTNQWQGTFADIDDEARRLVSLLRGEGLEPGAVIAFQIPNWREAVVSFAALAMGGYVLVPIVHIYGAAEVAFILDECGAEAYISPASFGYVDYTTIVDERQIDGLRLHVVVGEGADAPAPDAVRRVAWDEVAAHEPATDLPEVAPADAVVLAYTSGTTSDPKGVIHDHRTLLAELAHINGMAKPDMANLMGSPVTHATGMLGAVLSPLWLANPIHLIDRWDPGHALEVMAEHGIGGGTGASVFLSTLLDHPDFTPEHAANMPYIGLGGAPVPIALGERAESWGIRIIRAYGSTEHPSISGSTYEDPPEKRHRTDGRALPGVELRLVDADGNEVAAGEPGEIVSRGPDLCMGYTNPALNDAFDDEGWYRTGDIGILDGDGFLTITDRVKDIIIRGGENLSAAEIEDRVAVVPGVAEVAVVAAPDGRLGERACAVIRMQADAEPIDLPTLTGHLEAAGVTRQKWPEEISIVDDFPRTPSGKIRKVDLRARLREQAD